MTRRDRIIAAIANACPVYGITLAELDALLAKDSLYAITSIVNDLVSKGVVTMGATASTKAPEPVYFYKLNPLAFAD